VTEDQLAQILAYQIKNTESKIKTKYQNINPWNFIQVLFAFAKLEQYVVLSALNKLCLGILLFQWCFTVLYAMLAFFSNF